MSPRLPALALTFTLAGLFVAAPGHAFNYVSDSAGTWWGIQDVAPPRVDTGSIRATQVGPGQNPAYSTTINGFGGVKVQVPGTPRLNGELMRAVWIKKDLGVGQASYGRWLDTFVNTTGAPLTLKVAFGGQSGYSASGANSSALVNTSSGDAAVSASDTWSEVATPLSGTTLVGGPQATVIGTPAPFGGAMTFTGNWLYNTFDNPLAYGGHEGNFQAYVNTLTLAPGATKSLLHYIVLGQRVTAATSAAERLKVETTASTLAATPELADLTPAQRCSIDNFTIAGSCAGVGTIGRIPVPAAPKPVTTSGYDVVEKTIGQMRADMESGLTTSQKITRAYLDRIAVYDQGQFGFNSYEIVASDAMAQAA